MKRLRWECYILVVCTVFSVLSQVYPPKEQAASAPQDGVLLPIIMYHSLVRDPARTHDYAVTPDTLESDLRYLSEHGYHTVVVRDLLNYVDDGAPLPDKPVMLTFDDGHLNLLTDGLPLLRKYGMRAVSCPVGAWADAGTRERDRSPAYSYMTWEELRELSETGVVEVQNHSYDLHHDKQPRGAVAAEGEAVEAYQARFTADILRMRDALRELSGISSCAFVYPYGLYDSQSEQALRDAGFRASVSCEQRPNLVTRDPACLFNLGRYNRPAGVDTASFMRRVLSEP